MNRPSRNSSALPEPRGELSAAVIRALLGRAGPVPPVGRADPFGEDLTLALHLGYELHYQGFQDVDPDLEWDLGLLGLRAALERSFLDALRESVPAHDDVAAAIDPLLIEEVPGDGVSHYLRDEGSWWQMREFFAHRSVYHHKEADPHAWVIPRLRGRAKAAIVAVEYDEFGGGRHERMHSHLYAELLDAADLDPGYLHYLDTVPAPAIAIVNLMSLFGLRRSLRGALLGHFAAAEITTAPSARRMVEALRGMSAPEPCVHFYAEHIEADAVHEQVLRHDVIGSLLHEEPELAPDVVLGVLATEHLEARLGAHLLDAWRAGRTSLRAPLPDHQEAAV